LAESGCQNYVRQSKRKSHCFGIKHTIVVDGYTTEISKTVFILSKSIHDVVSFMYVIPQEESCDTKNCMGQLIIDALVKGTMEAGGSAENVEQHYAVVVRDNKSASIAGARIVEEK